MDSLIPLINKLQDIFALSGHDPLDLPQIVVVGCQSSGKSSVLENIVGKDFLPRGKDIVTRRPLLLQLVHLPPDCSSSGEEWGEFLHIPQQKFHSFSDIRAEIETDTLRVAGSNKGIAKIPIHLRIYSARFLNLTLVDLPGITKVPIGDQPVDIEAQIRQLVYEYISKPNSIILAVTPANTDLATSEALKIAKEVDPEGLRTLGVLTKIDLMDAGTNALDILQGSSELRLRLGFIGVVNRSQQDIYNNKPLTEALRHESEYFKSHPAYRAIAEHCGTGFLVQTLNGLLVEHIRESLPGLRVRLNQLIVARQSELSAYGPDYDQQGDTIAKSGLLLKFISKFTRDFCDCIEGNAPRDSAVESARINFIFNDVFAHSITPEAHPLSLEEVRSAIRSSTGTRPSLFVPEGSFDFLVKRQIAKIQMPGMRCVELVLEELLRIVTLGAGGGKKGELARFPVLFAKIVQVASDLIKERLDPTMQMVQNLIQIELSYVNTNHPDFMRAGPALATIARLYDHHKKRPQKPFPASAREAGPKEEEMKNRESGLFGYLFRNTGTATQPPLHSVSATSSPLKKSPTGSPAQASDNYSALGNGMDFEDSIDREELEVHLIYSLVQSYCSIVRKNLGDTIPKSIMHFLVNACREGMQNRLVGELYRQDLIGELLVEDAALVVERKCCRDLLEVYKKASNVLTEMFK